MSKKISLVGRRFGMLYVLEELPRRPGDKQVRYSCRCDCGNIVETDAACLRGGKGSCGCLRARKKELRLLREQETRERLMLKIEQLEAENNAKKCPYPSSWCDLSKSGVCCSHCDERDNCEDACMNNPVSCGYMKNSCKVKAC